MPKLPLQGSCELTGIYTVSGCWKDGKLQQVSFAKGPAKLQTESPLPWLVQLEPSIEVALPGNWGLAQVKDPKAVIPTPD